MRRLPPGGTRIGRASGGGERASERERGEIERERESGERETTGYDPYEHFCGFGSIPREVRRAFFLALSLWLAISCSLYCSLSKILKPQALKSGRCTA